jgi:YggT family protein
MLPIFAAWVLGPLLATYTVLFVLRIFLSWYPQLDTSRLPYSLVVGLTEFLLRPTRRLIPPLGGVDMAPVVWGGPSNPVAGAVAGAAGSANDGPTPVLLGPL